MFNFKALICKFSTIYRKSIFTFREYFAQITALNKEALDYSVEFRASITDLVNAAFWVDSFTVALAEFPEVFTCFRADVVKKFNNDFRGLRTASVDVQIDIASSWCIINCSSVSI